MPAYVLIDIVVTDPDRYAKYRDLGSIATAKYGGRFLARGGTAETLEGTWDPTRVVVVEFPDRATAKRWYDSPEYREARKVREGAATFRCIVVDGVQAG